MSNIKILIVEDEPIIAEDIADFLLEKGYSISNIAYDKAAALQTLTSNPPDAALLDINLSGGQEGLEVARFINQNVHIPFLFLTSYSDKKTLDQAKQTLPVGYISKPIDFQSLYTSLEIGLYNFSNRQPSNKLKLEKINKVIFSPLTKKEFEVLLDIYEGKNNKQIAEKHFVSRNTVKTHVKKIYDKLDVHTRLEVIAKLRSL